MLHIALHQPQIPPNTGNLVRFAANTGIALHLIHPLGFLWEDKQLRRAGLDYHECAAVQHHDSYAALLLALNQPRVWAFTTKAQRSYAEVQYADGDVLLFGSETTGLPEALRSGIAQSQWLRLPMMPGSRSLNLSNTAAVAGYEALRQLGFVGLG